MLHRQLRRDFAPFASASCQELDDLLSAARWWRTIMCRTLAASSHPWPSWHIATRGFRIQGFRFYNMSFKENFEVEVSGA